MSNENETAVAPIPGSNDPGALAKVDVAALQAQSKFSDDMFGGISGKRFGFLPRLQLFTSNSEQCKQAKIPVAHYGIIKGKDELIPLGPNVIAIPIAWRAKAMFVKVKPPVAYHNAKSEEFQKIKRAADADSNSGNMYGPEYLMWIPQHGFVTFFFGSKTARNEAPAMKALLPTAAGGNFRTAALSSTFIRTDEYSWHGPKVSPSSQSIDEPDRDALDATLLEFLNPQDSVVEEAPADATAGAPTDR